MLTKKMKVVIYTREGDSWVFISEASWSNGLPGPLTKVRVNNQEWIVTDCLEHGTFPGDGDRIRVVVKPKVD